MDEDFDCAEDSHLSAAYEERTEIDSEMPDNDIGNDMSEFPPFEPDDFETYNQNEADDYRDE